MDIKNWVEAAAHEIYDGGYDGTNPVRCTSEEEIQKVIEERCPFKPNIAYMPVPRCETCSSWTPLPGGSYPGPSGTCAILKFSSPIGLRMYVTSPDFGCVRWSEKS